MIAVNGTYQRRLRVAHVTQGLDVGGQEKLLVEFARHADRARFELAFVSLGDRGPLAADLEALGWPVVALGRPAGLRPGIVLQLAGLFRRGHVDVVHTHDNRPLLYGAPAARLARVPCVVHTKHYGDVAHITRRQSRVAALASRLTDRFVCVSQDSARRALAQGVPARRVLALWNGIDLTRFDYRGPAPDGPVVAVARLSLEKDIETLLRAIALAAPDAPTLRLEVAGNGPCLPALQSLAAELALGERVRFLGEVHDVPALLARASLFVLSSRTEGVSLTLLEAMARGLPVVATRVGGNPEVVAEDETGLLVPPRDPAALAAALLHLLRDPDAGRRMGRAGRRRVEEHFEIRRMVAGYEALYLAPERFHGEAVPNVHCRP
jgi:glycosyltransferase involved in cell wall biosynthesis